MQKALGHSFRVKRIISKSCAISPNFHRSVQTIAGLVGQELTINEDGIKSLTLLREASKNPKCRITNQLKILWRVELIRLVKSNKLGGVTAYNKKELGNKLYKNIEKNALREMICSELLERDYSIYEEK